MKKGDGLENINQIAGFYVNEELNELTYIASTICHTPIALITLLDDQYQHFLSKYGIDIEMTKREESFCQHALHSPSNVLIIEDSLKDERFRENNLVTGSPHIRFYAGAPLEMHDGSVLGTLCVLDKNPGTLNENQIKALQLLAKRAVNVLENQKILQKQRNDIAVSAEKLKKLTDEAPGVIFQFKMSTIEKVCFQFTSHRIHELCGEVTSNCVDLAEAFSFVHEEYRQETINSLKIAFESLSKWKTEYRLVGNDPKNQWQIARATPEKQSDGSVIWYGTFQNITSTKIYEQAMEQIAFDISHVLRRPVASLSGLATLFEKEDLSRENIKEYIHHIKLMSKELDTYTSKLNKIYNQKKELLGSSKSF